MEGGERVAGGCSRAAMLQLSDVYSSPLPDSPYVQPFRLNYTQNGERKTWDLLQVHDSVAVIVFNVSRRVLVMVRQFRPAVYVSCVPAEERRDTIDTERYPATLGLTLEVCAGIVDKDLPLVEIAKEEVREECGYAVESSGLQRVVSYRAGVGVQGAVQTLYYTEVTDDMRVHDGGGVDDELIEVVELSIPAVERLLAGDGAGVGGVVASPPSALFALQWFLAHKAPKWRKSYSSTCGECRSSAADQSAADQSAADQSAADQSAAEQSAAEQSAALTPSPM